MSLSVKEIQLIGNPNWPLPPDYMSLTADGQRLARINASRQWLLPGTHEERGRRMGASLNFFDRYYLWPHEPTNFNPYFYDETPRPTPLIHDEVSMMRVFRLSMVGMPRGMAKTTQSRKELIMGLVTRPANSYVYATASHDLTEMTGDSVKNQCYTNERIFNDWAPEPEFGGKIKPGRNERKQATSFFFLRNNSVLQCTSAQSRQRGIRPRRYKLDDPEYDPKGSTSMTQIREFMDTLLFKIITPTILRGGSDIGCDWTFTFLSRQHYAWHAMQGELVNGIFRARDPRFDHWERLVVKALGSDEDGNPTSVWPEEYPATKAIRLQLALTDTRYQHKSSLEEIRSMIGASAFESEYQGNPGSSEDSYFGTVSDQPTVCYRFKNADAALDKNPRTSSASICFVRDTTEVEIPLSEFFKSARLFLTADTSYTSKATSDYKAAVVMAITSHNELFVLDCRAGKCEENKLVQWCFELADKWRCSIHPEQVKGSYSFCQTLIHMTKTRVTQVIGTSFVPTVKPIRVGMLDKSSKISGLKFRFEHGLIKFPYLKRMEKPWVILFDQVEQFNPQARDGGLDHDDLLDCVSMSHFVLSGKPSDNSGLGEHRDTHLELLKKGDMKDEFGIPRISYCPQLSSEDLMDILFQADKPVESEGSAYAGPA